MVNKKIALAALPMMAALNANAQNYTEQWSYDLEGFAVGAEITDLENDGVKDIIILDVEGYLHRLRPDGSSVWEFDIDSTGSGSPGTADLDGDGIKEIVVGSADYLQAFRADGSLMWYTELNLYYEDSNFAPSFYDLDGDGKLEIVAVDEDAYITALNGEDGSILWQYETDDEFAGTAAVADLDGDGTVEIVAYNYGSHVYALDPAGNYLWVTNVGGRGEYTSPAVGDLDGDGSLEIVVTSTDGPIVALDSSGAILWSYDAAPLYEELFYWTAPAIGDVDGDGEVEVVALGSEQALLFVLDAEGNEEWVESLKTAGTTQGWLAPSLADVDSDGMSEIVAGGHNTIYVIEGDTRTKEVIFETGVGYYPQVLIDDVDDDGLTDFLIPSWSDAQAFLVAGSGVIGSSWSTYMMNNQRTGALPVAVNPDRDGDGVLDVDDACPEEDASGLDANGDGCIDQAAQLSELITALDLPQGFEKAFLAGARSAETALSGNLVNAAEGKLNAVIKKASALRGKKIDEESADTLIAFVENVLSGL